jgi:hypothetical protein
VTKVVPAYKTVTILHLSMKRFLDVNEYAVSVPDEFNTRVKICSGTVKYLYYCAYMHVYIFIYACIHMRRVWRYGRFRRYSSVSQKYCRINKKARRSFVPSWSTKRANIHTILTK